VGPPTGRLREAGWIRTRPSCMPLTGPARPPGEGRWEGKSTDIVQCCYRHKELEARLYAQRHRVGHPRTQAA
jgi:hypothetical protein